jgi:DNA-binding HxlR family transcriptional regulator
LLALAIVFVRLFGYTCAPFFMDMISIIALSGTAKILGALKSKGKMRYSELVDIVGFATTTTRALKAMEEAKLVTKQVVNEPYRPVVYSLTEKGRKAGELVTELEKL